MTSKEIIKEILKKWNFAIIREEENSIVTRYQLCFINIHFPDHDIPYVSLVTGIFRIESGAQHRKALELCNAWNNNVWPTKIYIDDEAILTISSGFFYRTEADVESFFETALSDIIKTKTSFNRGVEPMLINAAKQNIDLN